MTSIERHFIIALCFVCDILCICKYGIRIKQYILLVFLLFFPLVFFERGDSLSFIWGIYGHENLFSEDHICYKGIAEGSKNTNGLWSQVFV